MIYLTGDTHGEFSRVKNFCYEYETSKDDVLIILGDAGINYYLHKKDEDLKRELAQLSITLFCIHGNHEERPNLIKSYDRKIWRGGLVFFEEEYPNILFASDGEIYDFEVGKAIVIGGAYSVDKYYRLLNNRRWFSSEQPDDKIKEFVERRLEEVDWKIDFVFSHTGPFKYQPEDMFLPFVDQNKVDNTTEKWLDTIEEKLTYNLWYFGHFHCDRMVDKAIILYEDILELE